MAITGMVGGVYVSDNSIPPVPFLDATTTGDAARKRYQVVDPAHRYWPLDAEVTVKVNAVEVTTGFRLERAGGYVEFADALGAEDVVTVSGTALTLAQAGGFFNWSIDGDADDADATTFASQGWKEFARTLKGWSGSAEAYWGDRRFFDSLGKTVVVKLFVDSGPSQDCLEGFAVINGDGIEAPVEGLIQEAVDFTGTGPLYIRL
ncbi:MAG TPA: hypothetical protein GXX64_03510 [Bacteroidales bacterium]|nr:hypothetical protein [Bacteroidales bacterium]